MKSRLEDIYHCLKNQNFEVYYAGQHKGDCINPYVVVKPGLVMPYLQLSTNIAYYELLCYVPAKFPTKIETFKESVKTAMLEINPMVKFDNTETIPYFDNEVKGWMVDLTYKNYRKVNDKFYQKLENLTNQNTEGE